MIRDTLIAKAKDSGHLSSKEQETLAKEMGLSVRDLPLQWRGGLMGVFSGGESGQSDTAKS